MIEEAPKRDLSRLALAPFVRASVALHACAVAGTLIRPEIWPVALGALAADHLSLTGAGLWPRSRLLGPNWTRLPTHAATASSVAITIDDGPERQTTPEVLAILAAHGARATFFCIGARVQAHPELAREIVRQGHEIDNHTQHHLHHFSLLGPRGMAREIAAGQAAIEEITATTPRFFRAPAGLRNPFLDPVLRRLGLQLVSWTRRGFDTRERDATTVYRRLTRGLAARDILLLHDGHAARTPTGRPVILEVLPRLLAAVSAAGLRTIRLSEALP